ncbi:hypothetical protein B0H13DRAFT_2280300 [Mycena leptocephala]|nr:hypothetical protein B0H13DRAFT_2280300 [Mycena leptocephala]
MSRWSENLPSMRKRVDMYATRPLTLTLMEPSNSDEPGPSNQDKNSKKPKGKHGGARKNAGRPRKTLKAQLLGGIGTTTMLPLQQCASTYTSQAPSASSSRLPIAPFFLPYTTHRPVPLGNQTIMPAGRSSLWSALESPPTVETTISSSVSPSHSVQITALDLARLNEEISYFDENDEHADIAAGDRIIDDSLGDDSPGGTEDTTDTAEAEIPDDENCVLSNQLKAAKKRITSEIDIHKKPLCYERGDFFDRPPHPVFALKGGSINPSALYHRKIFVWLPHLLPGCPSRFKCTCGMPLSRKGFSDNPVARRVRDMPEDFFLFTNRLVCDDRRSKSPGCGTNHQGSDPHIIAQLLRFVQVAFPAYISARGAVSKLMMSQMSNTFAARFGAAPFSELVSEIQHRFHADKELMYLAAADFYGRSNVIPFSAFNDPQGYAGALPSVSYLKGLFTDTVTAYRIYIERYIASLPLTVASGDHTFQVIKYMGDLKGQPIFNAAYTVMNEFEEVRAHSLTQTKSLGFVQDVFEGIQEGLKNANHPPISFFTQIHPNDVEPITEWTNLPAFPRNSEIIAAFLTDSMEIEEAASDILSDIIAPPQFSPVALAIKTGQDANKQPHLEIIQLRTRDKIIVFEVSALTSRSEILPSLRAILTNPAIVKIDHAYVRASNTISDAFSLPEIGRLARAKNAPILDLGKYAKLKAVVEDPLLPLQALSGLVLRKSFTFPYHLSYPWLLPTQSGMIYYFARLTPTQAVTHGQRITLVQACKPVAEGWIVGHHPGFLDAIMDNQGHTKRINVLVPGSIHKLHNQTIEWMFTHGAQAVVNTSQLHTRGETPPVASHIVSRAFTAPAPPDLSQDIPEFTPSITFEFENLTEDMADVFMDENVSEPVLLGGVKRTLVLLQSNKLPSRVLDDAFHYMARLLRLLSKKNSAYKAFARDFSEAIFVRDQTDEINAHINHTKFRKGTKVYPPQEHWKNIDFLKFAQFWNELVDAQPRSVTDSNLRLYYKLPQQLEAHHKKTILWKSECATLSDGSNFAGRKQLLDILNSPDNYADTLPAIPRPEPMPDGELDLSIARYNDPTSFNPMAEQPAQGEAGDSEFPSRDHEFPLVDHLDESDSESALEDALQSIPSQPMQSASNSTHIPLHSPSNRPHCSSNAANILTSCFCTAGPKSKTKTRHCALCAKAECNKRSTCPGSGKQSLCMCGHPLLNGKKVHVSEATLIARLQRQSLGQG